VIANDVEYLRSQPMSLQCAHDTTRICRRLQSNGVTVYVRQCLHCGSNRGAVAKASPEVMRLADIPEWDQGIVDAWHNQRSTYYDRRRRENEATIPGSAEWWKQYNEYLSSPAWNKKRAIVLERDHYTCQGCFQARATQVHHLSYKHVGNELLFELVSVCDACHHKIHPDMDSE